MTQLAIHQFVHTLHYGDAISGETLAICGILREQGIESEIYSLHTHPKLKSQSRSWTAFSSDCAASFAAGKRVAVLFHYSIGSPLGELLLTTENITRILVYHNLTPEHWFRSYNPRVTADLVAGRDELPGLLPKMDIVLADSEFNRQELAAMGCADASVLPLLIDTKKWQVEANPGIRSILRGHGGVNLLHVGRIAPNKCIEDIIKTFYFYHHKIEKKSRLWLVGGEIDTELYAFELRRLLVEFRLKEVVHFVGSVADSELRAFYEEADCYLCMSEHEGFCVPLLEAMYFHVPTVAFAAGAVPATLEGGGVLVHRKRHAEIAELIDLLVTSPEMSQQLVAAGAERVNAFGPTAFAEKLRALVIEPLQRLDMPVPSERAASARSSVAGV